MRLNQQINHVAVLIHGTPEILLAIDFSEDFIQIPNITQTTLSSLQFPGIVGTEFPTPLPHGLVGDHDPTFGKKILDVAKLNVVAVPDA